MISCLTAYLLWLSLYDILRGKYYGKVFKNKYISSRSCGNIPQLVSQHQRNVFLKCQLQSLQAVSKGKNQKIKAKKLKNENAIQKTKS